MEVAGPLGTPLGLALRTQPFPFPGDLPDPGIEPMSPALVGRFFTTQPPGKPAEEDTQTQRNEVLAKNEGLAPPLSSHHFTEQML